jgi:hypothetical protein
MLSEHCTILSPGSILPPTCLMNISAMTAADYKKSLPILLDALDRQCREEKWPVIEPKSGHSYVLKGGTGTRLSALKVISGTRSAAVAEIIKQCKAWACTTDSVSSSFAGVCAACGLRSPAAAVALVLTSSVCHCGRSRACLLC